MVTVDIRSWSRFVRLGVAGVVIAAAAIRFLRPFAGGERAAGSAGDLLAAAIAAVLTLYGFAALRKKRLIEDVPKSRIRSVAMGMAELVGRVRPGAPLASPFSGVPCVYYRYRVEVEKSSGRGGRHWVTEEEGASEEPFDLEDETGRITVVPLGAEVELRQSWREVSRDGGWFSKRRRRTEWWLVQGQRVYILGTVGRGRDRARERREDLVRPRPDPADDLVIGRGETEATFIIADRGEASMARTLARRATLALVLGPALFLIMIASLLARAGVLPAGWAIPWESFG